ncbi:hypothetical protein WDU94_007090 [Cyamophila willieti]
MDMCPAGERILREKEHLIHPLEALGYDIHEDTALDFASHKSAATAQSANPIPIPLSELSRPQSASPVAPLFGSNRTDILVFKPQSENAKTDSANYRHLTASPRTDSVGFKSQSAHTKTDLVVPRFESGNISSESAKSRHQSVRGRQRSLGNPHNKLHFKADRNLMVKCYHRSAAGMELNDPVLLRPTPVLIQTVHHLMTRVVKSKRVPWCEVHWFVSDRLRSVRQDANIQQIEPNGYVMILEQCVQFYANSMYRQCSTHPSSSPPCVDKYLNRKQLEECLHQCINLYDEHSTTLFTPDEDSMPPSRIDVECVYLMVNIDSYAVLHRALTLEKCTSIQSTLQLCLYYSMQYYTQVFPCLFQMYLHTVHSSTVLYYSMQYYTQVFRLLPTIPRFLHLCVLAFTTI